MHVVRSFAQIFLTFKVKHIYSDISHTVSSLFYNTLTNPTPHYNGMSQHDWIDNWIAWRSGKVLKILCAWNKNEQGI